MNKEYNEITDEKELEKVSGGAKNPNEVPIKCPHCKTMFVADINLDNTVCPYCDKDIGAKG